MNDDEIEKLIRQIFDYLIGEPNGESFGSQEPLQLGGLSTSTKLRLLALRSLIMASSERDDDASDKAILKTWGRQNLVTDTPVEPLKTWGRQGAAADTNKPEE
ncbi:hypothetical protein D3C77_681350 [compost metagenome]